MPDTLGCSARTLLLLLGVALGSLTLSAEPPVQAPTSSATKTPERPHTAADCDDLVKQFDVAWPTHSDTKRGQSAQASRDQGISLCAAGNYADGVRALRRALHAIGVKPVKIDAAEPH